MNNGRKYKIFGIQKTFKSLDALLSHHSKTPLHPSIGSIGRCCESPRHSEMESQERRELTLSQMSHDEASRMLSKFREQDELYKKKIEEMDAKIRTLENRWCTIL